MKKNIVTLVVITVLSITKLSCETPTLVEKFNTVRNQEDFAKDLTYKSSSEKTIAFESKGTIIEVPKACILTSWIGAMWGKITQPGDLTIDYADKSNNWKDAE